MNTLITIIRASVIVKLAALGLAVGIGMLGYGIFTSAPPRASLQTAEGVVSEASRITHTSRRTRSTNSYFELTFRPQGGGDELKLRIPSVEIGETEVRSLIGRVVRAEFDSERDVYVLRSGNRDVLSYENTLERRKLSFRQYYVDGIALLIASAVLMLLGFALGYRKLRRQAGAAP